MRCFFYADVLKENILYDNDGARVTPNPIAVYKNTPYNKHYLFIKNAHDFYILISHFFTKPYLTEMFYNEHVSEEVQAFFDAGIAQIENKLDTVRENMIFVEGC